MIGTEVTVHRTSSKVRSPIPDPGLLPAEYQVLLHCVRTDLPAQDQLQVLGREAINWDVLLHLARRHRVVPLVARHVQRRYAHVAPPAVLQALQAFTHQNLQRNLLLTAELARLLRTFRDHGISAFPLKGPELAMRAYGSLALRHAGDLDILVEERQWHDAVTILRTLGYAGVWDRTLTLNPAQEALYMRHDNAMVFHHAARQVSVDLHWRLSPAKFACPIPLDGLWERLEPVSIAGTVVPTLSDEATLLYLCFHGTKHRWYRLAWICDLAALLQHRNDIAWDRVRAQAAAGHGQHVLHLGLGLAHTLCGSALPEAVWEDTQRDHVLPRLLPAVHRALFMESDAGPHHRNGRMKWPHLAYTLQWQPTVRQKVRYCLHILLPIYPTDWQLLPLPRRLFPMYYVVRPLRLLGKYLFRW